MCSNCWTNSPRPRRNWWRTWCRNCSAWARSPRLCPVLLEEGIPIRDVRTIAEALAEHAGKSREIDVLTSQVRISLGRTIFQVVNGVGRELSVMTLDSHWNRYAGALQGSQAVSEPS